MALLPRLLAASFATVLVVGCASAPDGPSSHSLDQTEAEDGGAPPPKGGPSGSSDAGAPSESSDGGDAGAQADAGGGGDASSNACKSNNACQTAHDLGAVAGDADGNSVSYEASGPLWLKVRVSETDMSVFGRPMKLSVSLVSPAGENFDLYVYGDETTDQVDCTDVLGKSTTNETDEVSISWGEGTFANDADDSRTISIEVRNASATCSANDKWTLVVQGNH
jgi:hypothetical protein